VPRGFVLLFEVAISAAYAASGVKVFFVTTAIDAACAFRSLGALFRLNALQVKNLRHYCLLSHLAVRVLLFEHSASRIFIVFPFVWFASRQSCILVLLPTYSTSSFCRNIDRDTDDGHHRVIVLPTCQRESCPASQRQLFFDCASHELHRSPSLDITLKRCNRTLFLRPKEWRLASLSFHAP